MSVTSAYFSSAFRQPIPPGTQHTPASGSPAAAAEGAAPISYARATYGEMQNFLANPDFATFQRQFSADIDQVVAFAEENLPVDELQTIRDNFATLKNHLFEFTVKNTGDLENNYFSTHIDVVYAAGRTLFGELRTALVNDNIPLPKRLDAVSNLSPKVLLCSGGIVSELQEAVNTLNFSTQGIGGQIWEMKAQLIRQLALQFVRSRHVYRRVNEIHYVNV